MFLFEKVAAAGKQDACSSEKQANGSPLTAHEQRSLDELEEDLPLQTIVMFRTLARREVR